MDPGTCGRTQIPSRIEGLPPPPFSSLILMGSCLVTTEDVLSYIRMVTVALRVLSPGHTQHSYKRVLLGVETPSTSLLPT